MIENPVMGKWYHITGWVYKHRDGFGYPKNTTQKRYSDKRGADAMYIGTRYLREGVTKWIGNSVDGGTVFYPNGIIKVHLFVLSSRHNPLRVLPEDVFEIDAPEDES